LQAVFVTKTHFRFRPFPGAPMATEGNLQAPTRHPLDWHNPDFYNEEMPA